MLPKPIKFTYQSERAEFIINELKNSNYDVVLLQEAFSEDFRKQLKTKLFSKYPHQSYLGRKRGSFTIYGSGAYLLSRLPISILENVHYADCAKTDCFASKGLSLAKIKLSPTQEIQIANTHLQSGKEKGEIRFKQLEQIKRVLDFHRKASVPQVLVGDLNIDAIEGDDFLKALSFLKMKNHPLEGDIQFTNGYPIDCYNKPGDDKKEWIDHIFLNQDFHGSVKNKKVKVFKAFLGGKECPLSDHYAVEATLSV